MTKNTELILASASPARKSLLDFLGIKYRQVCADIDEDSIMSRNLSPKDTVMLLAKNKAEAVRDSLDDLEHKLIVACDTVNTRGNKGIMGKPKNKKQARDMLMLLLKYSDRQHTGICIFDPDERKPIVNYEFCDMSFSNFREQDIEDYIASGEPIFNAGAFNPAGRFARTFGVSKKGYYDSDFAFPFEYLVPSLRRHGLLPDLGIKRIVVCSSSAFFDKLPDIKKELSEIGYGVLLPNLNEPSDKTKNKFNLIKEHFLKIEQANAVYIANFTKHNIKGYIGGNTLLEMGKAFDKGIPIFLKYDVPDKSSYKDEILAMNPVVIGRDWNRMNRILKKA